MSETPCTIFVPQAKLDIPRRKLEIATFPDEVENAERKYGVPLADIEHLASHRKDGYDWRKEGAGLNFELTRFTVDVVVGVEEFGRLNVDYVHEKSG